jgi:hypothetical protein
VYESKFIEVKNSYTLETVYFENSSSLAPAGKSYNWYWDEESNKWMSSFDSSWSDIVNTQPLLIGETLENKESSVAIEPEVVPVIKEHDHFLYKLVGYKKPKDEEGVIDIEPNETVPNVLLLPSTSVEGKSSEMSKPKSRRGRKPGQKDSKPRMRRTKQEIQGAKREEQ